MATEASRSPARKQYTWAVLKARQVKVVRLSAASRAPALFEFTIGIIFNVPARAERLQGGKAIGEGSCAD
jgi:hypothetical protein